MKINFSSLFQTPVEKYNFFFIYGNDKIVFERAISFLQKRFSCPLTLKTEEDLLKKTSSQPSLFDDKGASSLTLVSPITDKSLKCLDDLKDGVYIFTSEKARAQSKLVSYFSDSRTSLAIAAYASPITTSEFEFLAQGMDMPASFKGLLFKAYQNDYMGLLTTLEKIKLYGDVPEAEYASFLTASSSDELTPLLHAFLLKDKKKAVETFSYVNASEAISFLRSLTRTFQTLFDLMPFQRTPKSIVWMKLSPPVFFKDQPLYEAALSRWQMGDVQRFLETLLNLERQVKFSAAPFSSVRQMLLDGLK
jgi:DNA polymerase III delta subunit